jgi:asparagine synthase (glutamine-hydrolysing)
MRFFTCLLDPNGYGIPDAVRRACESLPRRRQLAFKWEAADHIAVLTAWDDPYGEPLMAQAGHWITVGVARLDNRAALEGWASTDCNGLSDLEVLLRVVARHGTRYVRHFLGDFAFVTWDDESRTAVAACDALGVRRLYYSESYGLIAFASRAEALASAERYEVQYLVELVSQHGPSPDLSVYAGVRRLPAGTLGVLERGKLALQRYWDVADFEPEPSWSSSEDETIETCRHLLVESIRLRLGRPGETWAQLSGGLDSSSVVSLLEWLAERGEVAQGLSGTVTYVDRQGTGADEREYSQDIVQRWHVRNETVVDAPTWHDDRCPPCRTDEPDYDLLFYPRNYQLGAIVRAAGGRVLLTGWGGDELFNGNMLFFADWLAQGRIWPAIREIARRAAIGRASFWTLAYRSAIIPLLPRAIQYRVIRTESDSPIQPWLVRATMRRYGLAIRNPSAPEYGGPIGQKYRYAVATKVGRLGRANNRDALSDFLDVRHPFLYRPLVEFALRLPPALRARPHAHRWVVREAMRGILPESVRTRVGKPDTGGALAWSLTTERARLLPLLREPILADLGVVHAAKLRAEFEMAQHRTGSGECMHSNLLSTLAIEAWLQIRSGRWPGEVHTAGDL